MSGHLSVPRSRSTDKDWGKGVSRIVVGHSVGTHTQQTFMVYLVKMP